VSFTLRAREMCAPIGIAPDRAAEAPKGSILAGPAPKADAPPESRSATPTALAHLRGCISSLMLIPSRRLRPMPRYRYALSTIPRIRTHGARSETTASSLGNASRLGYVFMEIVHVWGVKRRMAGAAKSRSDTSKWIRGRSAHLRGALLGLVLERPSHGGELANRLATRLGETWRIDSNDIYRLLQNLQDEGLVLAREEPRRDKRLGTRIVFHPTEQTSAALTRWIETLLPRETFRLGLHAKLAVAREQDVPGLRSALNQHKRECLTLATMMGAGDGEPRSWNALFMDCTRDGIHHMLQTELDWVNRTLRRIDEYAARRP